jgi:hypothetical protein
MVIGQIVDLRMRLENGGTRVEQVGEPETKDATRTRVKRRRGLALFSTLGLARLTGINGTERGRAAARTPRSTTST